MTASNVKLQETEEQILSDTMTSSSGSNFTAIQISRESIVQHTTQSGPEEFSLYMRTLPVMSYPDHYAVRCINNIKEANRHLLELKRSGDFIFGLDLEWRPQFRKGEKENKTALIQICNKDTILLLQVSRMFRLPTELISFLECPKIYKAGVNISGDGNKLQRDFGIATKGLLELSAMAELSNAPVLQRTHRRSLSALTAMFLEKCMAKGKVRMSNWAAATLKPKQKLYAATDAYASYALATKLYKMLSDDNRNKLPLFHVDSNKDQSRMREPTGNKSNLFQAPKQHPHIKGFPTSTTTVVKKASPRSGSADDLTLRQ
ncbi:hypothetical protein VTP01DRAFT_1965 [Rhizomucor pusillus]|uniref:uncharacterized protein n=1 Tax=Rhizomucor pusillus TaxID=4840 RepID=UPI003743383C